MTLRNVLIFSFYLLISNILFAQEGHVFISNFPVDKSQIDTRIGAIEFDESGLAYMAGRKGLAIFDGVAWKQLKMIPKEVNELKYDTVFKKMYIGFKDEIGVLQKDDRGAYIYSSIKKFGHSELNFNKVFLTSDKVYFYSNKQVWIIDKQKSEIVDSLQSKEGTVFLGIIKRKESVYINVESRGFHRIEGSMLVPVSTRSDLKNSKILFSTGYNHRKILFGTDKNRIYLFDGKSFSQFNDKTGISDFLQENILWDGINFSAKYFAVTTLTGGCAIIDKNYGKIVSVINYQTGLPDNEIYTIAKDINNGLWLTHEYGVSHSEPRLPLKYFSTYPEIRGNINDIVVKSGTLYVATSEGVFQLKRVSSATLTEQPISGSKRQKVKSINMPRKKAYIQQSITHQFEKISGLNDKCKSIFEFENSLLALTNYGVYEITGNNAIPVKTNFYPNDIFVCKDSNLVYVASLDGVYELKYRYDQKGNTRQWTNKRILSGIKEQVYSISKSDEGMLFLGLDSKVLATKILPSGSYSNVVELALTKPTFEPINIIKYKGQVYFAQSNGVFIFNQQKKQVLAHNTQSVTSKNLQYIPEKYNVWIKEDEKWKSVLKSMNGKPTSLLSMFEDIRHIYTDDNENIWFVAGNNDVLKLPSLSVSKLDFIFQLAITSISDNNGRNFPLNKAYIPGNTAIQINLSAPFYLCPEEVQFQYKFSGLKNQDWSDWSKSNRIELSSLNSGRHEIHFRARNVFNQISNKEELIIRVLKPWWQTKSFIISGILGFFSLVGLVFYITHKSLIRKKRVLEQKVQERTVELQEEKDKTESLLLNILPRETADELKKNNKVVPRKYDNATVLFTDFKGFTHIAEKLAPEELVNEIDSLFKEFDAIIGMYRIEKIKTIGDAYMCAGGLPAKYKHNSIEVVKAALDIRDYMEKYRMEKEKNGIPFFEIRIGIHTGKVVAGVVGTRKYAYDIWGDAVNLASRMESSGEPGKVNVSGDTYKLIKDKFICTYRGKIEAKNKGQVDMYFVEGLKGRKK